MDEKGHVFAVVTADVSLEWLSQMTDSLRYYNHSYSFILSHKGTFITNPSKQRVLHETIFSSAKEVGDSALAQIGRDMIAGKTDMRPMQSPKWGKSFIFYKPITHTNWSMAIVCSAEEFFKNAKQDGLIVAVIILVMLIVLTFILRDGVRRLTLPLTQVTQAVKEVAYGNLEAPLPKLDFKFKDEMARLYYAFHSMQESLIRQMEEL